MRPQALRDLRGGLAAMIFQEPMTALDPVYTVGQQIGEAVRRHTGCGFRAARERALELLELVRIPSPERRLDAYPHELSGGLRQRAMIAMALSCNPRLLLADEPTTALDATVQVQVLILLRRLQRELGMGMIFVTHDLGVASRNRRYGRGHVCRPHCRERAGCADPERTGTSLHRRPPGLDRAWSAARSRYRRDPRQPARPPPPGAGLQLRAAVSTAHGRVPRRRAPTALSRTRPHGRVSCGRGRPAGNRGHEDFDHVGAEPRPLRFVSWDIICRSARFASCRGLPRA